MVINPLNFLLLSDSPEPCSLPRVHVCVCIYTVQATKKVSISIYRNKLVIMQNYYKDQYGKFQQTKSF